jgi:Serine hydrolase
MPRCTPRSTEQDDWERPDLPLAAALLVAPADPDKFGVSASLPHAALGLPSTLVASDTDPWMSAAKAATWAGRWRSAGSWRTPGAVARLIRITHNQARIASFSAQGGLPSIHSPHTLTRPHGPRHDRSPICP